MVIQLFSLLLVFQFTAATVPQLSESDYLLLREGDVAPFSGVLLLDDDYRELKIKESELLLAQKDLEIAKKRFEASEKSYLEMKEVAEECAANLDKINKESPAWYESVEFWIGAVVGAGLAIATAYSVNELK